MRVAKTMTIDLKLINRIDSERKETKPNRSFSQMVEHILRSHYTEKDRSTSDRNES